MSTKTIPAGYWENANGSLIPVSKIKDIDKDRHRTVTELCEMAKEQSARLFGFKVTAMQEIANFVQRSLADYEVKTGGHKGNVTLTSYDGRYKIVRQIQESITFDERLQAAKQLLDECVRAWTKGANDNLKLIVNDAFQVDKQGRISVEKILSLRRHKITDEPWLRAMQAIGDSVQVTGSKAYIRFFERDEATGGYVPISLDVAAL